MKPRSFGEILDGAFQIFRRHFLVLGLTTLLPSGLSALMTVGVVEGTARGGGEPATAWALFVPVWLLVMALTLVAWGALSRQTSEACTGGRVALADGYRAGVRAFFRLLGSAFLVYLLLWTAMLVIALPLGILAAVAAPALAALGGAAAGAVGAMLGAALGMGILVAVVAGLGVVACTLPAVVVEGLGPLRAVRRSQELSRGAVLRSGAVVLVAFLIAFLPALGVMMMTGQLGGMFGAEPAGQPTTAALFLQQLGGVAVGAFTTPFLAAVITVLYYDRRVRLEALDVQLATQRLGEAQQPT